MKCRDAHEMMHSYFDNKIDPMKDKNLAEHIHSCPKCRAELDFLINYRNILKNMKPVPPPDNFLIELHRRIESEKSENPVKRIIDILKVFLSNYNFHIEAAGVLAIAALVFFLYRPFFNEQIPEKTSEYEIESPRSETPAREETLKKSVEQDGAVVFKDMPSVSKEISPGAERIKDSPAEFESADDNIAAAKKSDYDSSGIGMMKKSRSAESEKNIMKSEENAYVTESMDTKTAAGRQEFPIQASESDIEKIFKDFNVSIIKRDLSRKDGLYYKVRINSGKHTSLAKAIKEKYIMEEKVINKKKTYLEIELFLKKKKN
jgi:hypothetical protein